jgi:hypothetical protein
MAGMGWRTTGDVVEFLGAAGGYLRQERARNTVLLTVTEQLRANAAPKPTPPAPAQAAAAVTDPARLPLFGWWTGQSDEVGGAFMHTPPHPLLLTAVPAAAAVELAAGLDNPVSNSIYQRIGYRAVEDRVVLAFSAPGATGR